MKKVEWERESEKGGRLMVYLRGPTRLVCHACTLLPDNSDILRSLTPSPSGSSAPPLEAQSSGIPAPPGQVSKGILRHLPSNIS